DARPGAHAGGRGALRSRVSGPLLHGLRPLRSVSPRRGGRNPENARVGGAAVWDSSRYDPRTGAADGGEADSHQRKLHSPALGARGAGAVDGRHARGDAGADRATGWRIRPGVWLARIRRSSTPPEPPPLPAAASESDSRAPPVPPLR